MLDDPDRLMPCAADVFIPRSKVQYIYKLNDYGPYCVVAKAGEGRVSEDTTAHNGEVYAVLPDTVKTERDLKNWWNSSHS